MLQSESLKSPDWQQISVEMEDGQRKDSMFETSSTSSQLQVSSVGVQASVAATDFSAYHLGTKSSTLLVSPEPALMVR